ncbi:MAG: hypothetical protein ACK56I_05725, partial [bacterium]
MPQVLRQCQAFGEFGALRHAGGHQVRGGDGGRAAIPPLVKQGAGGGVVGFAGQGAGQQGL